MRSGFFITSTSTEIGKTIVSRAISRALFNRGFQVAAIKPIETGCNPFPLDAIALGRSCGRPELASIAGLYRSNLPLSPYSASIISSSSPPDIPSLSSTLIELFPLFDAVIIESAGGLLSPIDSKFTMADFALQLGLPLLAVVRDSLGVISQTLTLFESAFSRNLTISGLVLVRHEPGDTNVSPGSNFSVLSDRISCPVFPFPYCLDNDDHLSSAAESSGLLSLFPFA
jgi:dethiobiotin synthase